MAVRATLSLLFITATLAQVENETDYIELEDFVVQEGIVVTNITLPVVNVSQDADNDGPETVVVTPPLPVNPELKVAGDGGVAEGSDLVLICSLPGDETEASDVTWLRNNVEISSSEASSVSDTSVPGETQLLFKSVTRDWSGMYYCFKGGNYSNGLDIKIKYKPVCIEPEQDVGVDMDDQASITCMLNAHPPVSSVRWWYNKEQRSLKAAYEDFSSEYAVSQLNYKITGPEKWGTLHCLAQNEVGSQETSCKFSVKPTRDVTTTTVVSPTEEDDEALEDTSTAIPESVYLPPPASEEEAFDELVIDESGPKKSEPRLYVPGKLPRPTFVMLGQQGVGKSSMANALLGFDNLASLTDKKVRKKLPFQIGHGLRSKTRETSFSTGRFLASGPNVTVVDTPGFKDTDDAEFIDELMNVLGDEVKEVDSFLIVYKYKDRFTRPFKRTLSMITKMFGNFWTNVVLVVNFWSFKAAYREERQARGVTMKSYAKQLRTIFQNKFDLDFELPVVFIDTHYNKSNEEELQAFQRQTDILWRTSLDRKPFECLTRKDVQEKLRQEKQDLATMRRNCRATTKANQKMEKQLATQDKQIKAQMFVMTNLRNGIDYLKAHCFKEGAEEDVVKGCQWSEWTGWSECTRTCGGGTIKRVREKLPGLGSCDGPEEEVETCENEVCPLENDDNSLVVVIGGETSVSRENEHSTSIEVIGANGLCRAKGIPDLPEGRGKLCAAYDPAGALIVCGGGERFWRPNANCWQLVAGMTEEWQKIPQMYPVHGAAVAFYQGKFWVFGGSTGDDSYDHTITDKVQAYSPRQQQWSVETPLTSPRHKACAVAIDDYVIITGGTMLGLGKVKPVWLAEIGTRTAEKFDGQEWTDLPSLSRAKVEHGCTVATIGESKGILVVGGATGDDLVEFLDWDAPDAWQTLGKLNRGRGMMPGIGFIGGKLSIIGGYSWPGGVELIEEWDADTEEWVKSNKQLKYPRYNHATVTVPGDLFPQCMDKKDDGDDNDDADE